MIIHERYIVTVHGDKPPYPENRDYYDPLAETAFRLAEERGVPISLNPLLMGKGSALIDIVSPSEEFSHYLADELRKLQKYQRVEVRKEPVDRDTTRRG